MSSNNFISKIGEVRLIELIEDLILKETGERLIKDDAFFFKIQNINKSIVLNSDMFVSTTDAPSQMSFFQMGHKSVIMNISDLVVKGIEPKAIIISLGLPNDLKLSQFKDLIMGIISCAKEWNLKYLGGDLNKTKEIVINPTVFGLKKSGSIIKRAGMKEGDYLAINGRFGLTFVGFDILLKNKGNKRNYPKYERSINSVLYPHIFGKEAYFLSDMSLATASIDSSDGFVKSLRDLMLSNRGLGFEIEINKDLIDHEALIYADEHNIPTEKLILYGGEEFIHLFTIPAEKYEESIKLAKSKGGFLIKVGKVISEEKIYFLKNQNRLKINDHGYEHFK